MVPRIKQLWVQALKSDDYKQNLQIFDEEYDRVDVPLRTECDHWSAFGVLCNLYAMEHPEEAALQLKKTQFLGYEFYIPRKVAIWAGLYASRETYKSCISIRPFYEGTDVPPHRSLESMIQNAVPHYIIADVIDANF